MAAKADVAAQQPISAQIIGNAFVQQYYHILHHSPGIVHRFYEDKSKIGRPEEDSSMSTTTTMEGINEKILALNYGDCKAEIFSVDALDSYNGGVDVLVTGFLTGKDNIVRAFVQSFFLAPQDRGYFVLSDIFRFVKSVPFANPVSVPEDEVPAVVPVTDELVAAPIQENHDSEQSVPSAEEAIAGEVYDPPEKGDVPVVVEEEEEPVVEVVDEVQDDTDESNAKIEELPKKSYASMLSDFLQFYIKKLKN